MNPKLPTALLLAGTLTAYAVTNREITDTGPWGDYEAFPDVCRQTNGDLMVVFYAGSGHVTNPNEDLPKGGAVYGMRSTDQAKTWSAPFVVVDGDLDDRDPHVTQLSNGDLLVSYFTSRYYEEDGQRKREGEVWVARSRDHGHTWESPIRVTTPFSDKAGRGRQVYVSGPVVQLKGAHVALPVYHAETPGHYVTAVVHSDDYGATWTSVSPVDEAASLAFSYGFCEASMARLGDGRVIIVMRPGMHQAYSSDEGYTWTKATKLPHRGDAPTVFRTSRDLLLIAHRHPGTAVTVSADSGKTWGNPWVVDTVGGAYPGLAELDDGAILCIYYEEGKASDIRQAVFHIEPGIRLEDQSQRWPPEPPPGRQLDLAAMVAEKTVTVTTDMNWSKDGKGGPDKALDGSIDYWDAAWKPSDTGSATYAIELDREYTLTGLGVCLKRSHNLNDFPETAAIYASTNGTEWGTPVAEYRQAVTNAMEYTTLPTPLAARFVKIAVTDGTGWRAVTELAVYVRETAAP